MVCSILIVSILGGDQQDHEWGHHGPLCRSLCLDLWHDVFGCLKQDQISMKFGCLNLTKYHRKTVFNSIELGGIFRTANGKTTPPERMRMNLP